MDISGRVAKELDAGKKVVLLLNLSPEKTVDDWLNILNNARKENGKRLVRNIFTHHLPQAVAYAAVQAAGIGDCIAAVLSRSKQDRLLETLTQCRVNVSAVESWDKAMASTGGVDRKQVNSRTMQSREIGNLYLAGEFIDVDGPCGGYNIQWAFSSGRLAGMLKK